MKNTPYKNKAFTLIEIAIVLIIMGIIVGSSTKIFISMSKNSKIHQTQDLLLLMSSEISGFSSSFNRLPTQAEFESFQVNRQDSWGKLVRYIPSKSLTNSICSYNKSALQHREGEKSVSDIAFFLVSSGSNRNLQTAIPNENTQIIRTGKRSQNIDFNKATINRVEPFDDLYVVRSLWSLKNVLACKKGF